MNTTRSRDVGRGDLGAEPRTTTPVFRPTIWCSLTAAWTLWPCTHPVAVFMILDRVSDVRVAGVPGGCVGCHLDAVRRSRRPGRGPVRHVGLPHHVGVRSSCRRTTAAPVSSRGRRRAGPTHRLDVRPPRDGDPTPDRSTPNHRARTRPQAVSRQPVRRGLKARSGTGHGLRQGDLGTARLPVPPRSCGERATADLRHRTDPWSPSMSGVDLDTDRTRARKDRSGLGVTGRDSGHAPRTSSPHRWWLPRVRRVG